MSRRKRPSAGLLGDARGVVYVEFLMAFLPLFLLFLGICQLALMHTARLVVQHAAFAAVRSAIVVLNESPADYDGAERGSLSRGRAADELGLEGLLARLGLLPLGSVGADATRNLVSVTGLIAGVDARATQQGARMVPIREAAYMPIMVLAPSDQTGTLAGSVASGLGDRVQAALEYSRAASVITLQAAPGSPNLAPEPLDSKASLTVRVTYVFECSVPLVSILMCSSLESLLAAKGGFRVFGIVSGATPSELATRLQFAESSALEHLVSSGARFTVLNAEATLPNQGAGYEQGTAG